MHRAFVSYHHANDQSFKDDLVRLGKTYGIFQDWSVDTGDIPDDWDDQKIRSTIRDDYLRDSSVTIVLVGSETRFRKHVDWEIYSSMRDSALNRKSGILVIQLPGFHTDNCSTGHFAEQGLVYPDCQNWFNVETKSEYETRYPYLPERIIDNLHTKKAKLSVTTWERVLICPERLRFLVNAAAADRHLAEYDLSKPMRRNNGSVRSGPFFQMV